MSNSTTTIAPKSGIAGFEVLVRAIAWTAGTTHVVFTRHEDGPLVPVEFSDAAAAWDYSMEFPERFPRHAEVSAFPIAL